MFDTRSLSFVDHWPPNADWYSMTLSSDGRQLYVADLADVDADGYPRVDQGASLTVLDAASGQVRAVLGQLAERVDLGLMQIP